VARLLSEFHGQQGLDSRPRREHPSPWTKGLGGKWRNPAGM